MISSYGTCTSGAIGSTLAAAIQFFAASQCLLDEPWPNTAPAISGSHYDFIIVGAGTAGSTLAARLASIYPYDILLIEAGGNPPDEAIIPAFRGQMKSSPYDWNFTTVNDGISSQALLEGRQVQPRGKMLGGSGSINDMVYSRGHPQDYYEWADILGDSWNWTTVLEYFKKTENMTNERIINDNELFQYHGVDGEIEVSGKGETRFQTLKILEAFNELGIDTVNDMTYPYKLGAGRFSHTITNGRRDSSLTALLNKVHTNNLYVLNDTYVTKILIENDVAVGVQAVTNGEEVVYYANKEVIISAGTFNSPKILMLSGIGPKEHLEELGIEVVRDLPVGDNLHDHVMILNYLAINKGTCPMDNREQNFEMIKYFYDFSGTYSYSDSIGIYLPRKDGAPNVPHFAIYPTCMPAGAFTPDSCLILGYESRVCDIIVSAVQDHDIITLPVVLLKPESRGNVRLSSTDPTEDPLIYSGAFNNVADYEGYGEAIKFALSIANTTYFESQGAYVVDIMWEKCSQLDDVTEQFNCFVKDYAMPAWHAVGTVAMGSVVDADMNVLGIEGLRVVDASVMPLVTRGNTNAPVVMIAEKAADAIKQAHNSGEHIVSV